MNNETGRGVVCARRDFLRRTSCLAAAAAASGLGMLTGPQAVAASKTPDRIVVMDWPLTETLLALGVVPVGVSAPDWYRRVIVEPPLPSNVVNVGLLYSPNYDVLDELAPDLMIITPGHAPARALLERLAPTLTLGRYTSSAQPYPALRAETMQMAQAVGRRDAGKNVLERTDSVLAEARARLARRAERLRRPVIVADLIDDRHLRVYGAGSLFDAMMSTIGVTNVIGPSGGASAWPTGSGGFAVVSMQRLFELPQASLLLTGDIRPSQRAALAQSAIWQALPSMTSRCAAVLPVVAPNGGLISMQRFALGVEQALTQIAEGGGGLG
ncbi:ABC transporter substrate-binding protein [Pararobbsia silviterrae]|uniref:Twin-arginine translocation signal domain-containing protein n=1 Tax=Pararobbsia silviterrae TaxID=1792498 RepID=A0A494XRP3_9BURK|nr:ABC transporter substrate-binding protein [Pararobbsia silviterrae]RKP53275.1 twin-arginine translocation signal domain-containing protein [Pararobbsia silviterrae]